MMIPASEPESCMVQLWFHEPYRRLLPNHITSLYLMREYSELINDKHLISQSDTTGFAY
jgi:hypothetical protein